MKYRVDGVEKRIGLEWLAKEQDAWSENHRIATVSRIERLIFPRIGKRSIDSLAPLEPGY